MRFYRENYDLIFAPSLAGVFTGLLITLPAWQGVLRVGPGLTLLLVVPGYVLTAVLFPKRDLAGTERLALSLGLSVVMLTLTGLALNATPWGIWLLPVSVSITGLTALLSWVAILRRRRTNHDDRFSPARYVAPGKFLGLCALLLFSSGAAMLLVPAERYTEFYALGQGRRLENYPRRLSPAAPFSLRLGVSNHEGRALSYEVRTDFGAEAPLLITPTIQHGDAWEAEVELRAPDMLGENRLVFELFRPGDTVAYRSLTVFVDVSVAAQDHPSPRAPLPQGTAYVASPRDELIRR